MVRRRPPGPGSLPTRRSRGIPRAAAVSALLAAAVVASTAGVTAATPEASSPSRGLPRVVDLGAVPAQTRVAIDVVLRPRSAAALARLAVEVSTPGSRLFRHYLGRGQFVQRFGPSPVTIRRVTRWLGTRGLEVSSMSANHLTLHVTASASALDRALGVALVRVRDTEGAVAFTNARASRLGPIARFVQGVVGLEDVVRTSPAALGSPTRSSGRRSVVGSDSVGPKPCASASDVASRQHAYTANQLAAAYRLSGAYNSGDEGEGVTIALVEEEVNAPADVDEYEQCYGIDTSVSYVQVDGGSGDTKMNAEADEDIEVAMGLAPRATFDVYQAPPTLKGALDDYTAIVDRDTARVVSTSWGQCESATGATVLAAESAVFEQAAVQGQSVFAASGDSGATDCSTNALAVDDPASQVYVTGVGGTQLEAFGPPPTEVAWNAGPAGGAGGGGISSVHAMPSYQSNAPARLHVVNRFSSGAPCGARSGYCREVPDVSADADYESGYVMYYDGHWESNGGTSAAAPLWAAIAALADASRSCHGRSIGFANPALYEAAATSYAGDFNDVTSGTNDDTRWGNTSGLYPAGAGYDLATGLGTPIGGNLIATLCSEARMVEPTSTALSVSRSSARYGSEGDVAFTVHVSGRHGEGRPVGSFTVWSGTTRLCRHAMGAISATESAGRCTLGATTLKAGTYDDLVAVYEPAVTSSTSAHVRYKTSRSKPASLTIRPA